MIKLIQYGEESTFSYKPIFEIKTDVENSTNVIGLIKAITSRVNKMLLKYKPSNTPILIMNRASGSARAS